MSSLSCRFCSHRNPEGSKFCNECGSPLNLVPCAQCEAINNVADEHCTTCGAPWRAGASSDPTMILEPTLEATQGGHDDATADGRATPRDATVGAAPPAGAVPVALADRLEHDTHDEVTALPGPRRRVEQPVPSRDFTFTPGVVHDDPLPRAARSYSGTWQPSRLRSMLLGVAFVAIVGAVTWTSVNPALWRSLATEADAPSAAPADSAPVPAASSSPPATPAEAPGSQDTQATTQAAPTSAAAVAPASSDTPSDPASGTTAAARSPDDAPDASATAPSSPEAAAAPGAPPPSSTEPASGSSASATGASPDAAAAPGASAQASNPSADATPPADGAAGETGTAPPGATEASAATKAPQSARVARESRVARRAARPAEKPNRPVGDYRTREQAERDALATQRLIARELGNAPRGNAAGSPPAPR
jgi:hypothetical protein